MKKYIGMALVCGLLAMGSAQAGNGHFLHGFGAKNSAMGGAGVGIPVGMIGAINGNPALLAFFDQPFRIEFSTEFFKDDLSATTSPNALGQQVGFTTHTTKSEGNVGVIPSFAFAFKPEGKKYAFGFGLIGVAGFRTNFPVDPRNMMLTPMSQNGFGRVNTDLSIIKVPTTFAYQVTPKFAVGLSAVVFQGKLVVQPLPVVSPDLAGTSANFTSFRPSVATPSTSYSYTAQVGLYYEINEKFSAGASYYHRQRFDKYRWESEYTNPANPATYWERRVVEMELDGPPVASVGIGIRPNDKLKIALDARWVGYDQTIGIGKAPDRYKGTKYEAGGGLTEFDEGGNLPRYALVSIGWGNIWIGMLGVEYLASDMVTLRGGLNFNQSPIQTDVTLNSGGTPSVFTQHYTGGASIAVTPNFSLDMGFYYTPENSKTGPFPVGIDPVTRPQIGEVTLTNSIISGLVAFSWSF